MHPSERFAEVRQATERICQNLEIEDFGVQAWPYTSPAKWHLGHTSWFFETFCLRDFFEEKLFDETFPGIFNSYYESQGPRIEQSRRGVLSRPTVHRVLDYRAHVNERMQAAFHRIASEAEERRRGFFDAVEIGLHHEMQHQELLFMDLKAAFFHQPGYPAAPIGHEPVPAPEKGGSVLVPAGLYEIGATDEVFSFDLEKPRHRVYLEGAELSRSLATNAEYLDFIRDEGYERPELWLSAGWSWVRASRIEAPLYWVREEQQGWREFTLSGLEPLDLERPVSHVSFYEADAFARWRGARLPTEAEWEAADSIEPLQSTHWQWTSSAYLPYPGFRPLPGAFGEYNGKFMSGQMVLRGNCFATPAADTRRTARNFFSPEMRWQFSAIRLCKESPK